MALDFQTLIPSLIPVEVSLFPALSLWPESPIKHCFMFSHVIYLSVYLWLYKYIYVYVDMHTVCMSIV